MLTKEKCKEAVSILKDQHEYLSFNLRANYPFSIEMIREVQDCFEKLIKEHFELVKKYDELYERHSKILDDVHDYRYETQSLKIIIRNLCKHFGVESEKELQNIYLNKPYKFEELKKGMWVWDDKGLYCFECNPAISTDMAQCVTYNAFWYNCGEDEDEFFEEYDEFEEGRFYPVTKALEYQK